MASGRSMTRAQLKGSHGGLPYPTQHQYTHPWHADGKGPQPGTKMLIGDNAWAEEPEDWSAWTQGSGYALCFRQVPARKAVETVNTFEALSCDDPEAPDPPKPVDRPKPGTPLPLRLAEEFSASRRCCSRHSNQCRYIAGAEKSPAELS